MRSSDRDTHRTPREVVGGDEGPPDTERVLIRAGTRRGWLGVRELWSYRELIIFFTWRDVKVRYKQTIFGAAWAVLQPFLLMVVFTLVLGRLAKVPSDGLPYPVFAYSGLVAWTLFAQGISQASTSLVTSANLVSKVYFPRLVVPIGAIGSYVVDFIIAFGLLVAMMVMFRIPLSPRLMLVPIVLIGVLIVALSVGVWLAALNVRYRDVQYAVPFLVQLWLFATPIAYPASLVPRRVRPFLGLNPMAGLVGAFRWATLGTAPPSSLLLVSFGVTLAILLLGLFYFRRTERTFADWI